MLDRLLGLAAGAAAAVVPAVEPDVPGAVTIREQLEKHRAEASRRDLSRKIDPPGSRRRSST